MLLLLLLLPSGLLTLLVRMSSPCRCHCGSGFAGVVVVLDVAAEILVAVVVVIAEIVAHFANYCVMT